MQYAIIKWHFTTIVRFGNSKGHLAESDYIMHSDTLFSALCQEALAMEGEGGIQKLYDLFKNNRLIISDTMPYRDETYFLPKPILHVEQAERETNSVLKKANKNLKYISTTHYNDYLAFLRDQKDFDVINENNLLADLVNHENRVMVSLQGNESSQPFYVDGWRFADDAGLYFIVGYQDDEAMEWLESLLNRLELSGGGGKRNSGFGKFEMEDPFYLDEYAYSEGLLTLWTLLNKKGKYVMTLSNALPTDEEMSSVLDGASYRILKRSGFVSSPTYAKEQRKHRDLYVFSAGSCFKTAFSGDIYDVAINGNHPVYRYAIPFFVEVSE